MTDNTRTNYEVKKIFMGSPGDVPKERKIFREVVDRVNKLKANSVGVHLEPIGWEDTLPGVGRPQSKINADLLKCDLVILMLWNRWGSKTGNYSSGFKEEYELAKSEKKEIWLFFKNISDEMLSDPGSQLEKVILFRDMIENERNYFFKRFSDEKDWKTKLEEYLCDWLDDIGPIPHTGIMPEHSHGFAGLEEAYKYLSKLEELKENVDEYIGKLILKADSLVLKAKKFAESGRFSKADEFYANALSITNNPRIVAAYGEFLVRIHEWTRAEEKFIEILEIGKAMDDKTLQNFALSEIGHINSHQGKHEEAEKLTLKVLNFSEERNDKMGILSSYERLGFIFSQSGRNDKAEIFFKKALKLQQKMDRKTDLNHIMDSLAISMILMGNLDSAEDLLKKLLTESESQNDLYYNASANGSLGNIFILREDYDEAEYFFNKELDISQKIENKDSIATSYGNLGVLNYHRNNLDLAKEFFEKAIELNKENNQTAEIAGNYGFLGKVMMEQNQINEAERLIKLALKISKEFRYNSEIADQYRNLGSVYFKDGQYIKAENTFQESLTIFEKLNAKNEVVELKENIEEVIKKRKIDSLTKSNK